MTILEILRPTIVGWHSAQAEATVQNPSETWSLAEWCSALTCNTSSNPITHLQYYYPHILLCPDSDSVAYKSWNLALPCHPHTFTITDLHHHFCWHYCASDVSIKSCLHVCIQHVQISTWITIVYSTYQLPVTLVLNSMHLLLGSLNLGLNSKLQTLIYCKYYWTLDFNSQPCTKYSDFVSR